MNITINAYTIRDNVAKFYIQPFFAPNDGVATRMWIQSLGDSWPHRDGFALYSLGSFDTDTGHFEPTDPTLVLSGNAISEKYAPHNQGETVQ